MVIGGGPEFDEKDIVIVNVTNRGRTPVLITNLLLWEMPTWRARWRRRPTRTFVVANTSLKGSPPNIPFLLEPARIWTGVARRSPDIIPDLHNGNFYLGVCTSDRDRPTFRCISAPKPKSLRNTPQPASN
jgi:hypothetical protein